MGAVDGTMTVMNGTAGAHGGDDYQQWMEAKVAQGKASPQTQRHGGEVYSNTLPVRKVAPAKSKTTLSKDSHCGLESNQGPTCIWTDSLFIRNFNQHMKSDDFMSASPNKLSLTFKCISIHFGGKIIKRFR